MCFNDKVSKFAHGVVNSCRKKRQFKEIPNEKQPLLSQSKIENGNGNIVSGDTLESDLTLKDIDELGKLCAQEKKYFVLKIKFVLMLEEFKEIWKWPEEMSNCGKCLWVMTWPISFVLYITIPDCRKHLKWYPVSFVMCMVWIGSTSYTVAWFITVIG